jgi:prolyl oligopeptidase
MVTLFSGWQNQNRKYYSPATDLLKANINWMPLIKAEDNVQEATIYNENVYIISRKDAPKGKVLMTPVHNFDMKLAKTIIPETEKNIEIFTGINLSRNYLFILRTDGINSQIEQYNVKTGQLNPVKFPFSGSIWVSGSGVDKDEFIIGFASWSKPSTLYHHDALTAETTISAFNTNVKYPGVDDLIVEEVEVPGHDGVMVPLSLIYNKNIKKDGSNVVYMSGYGSYGVSSGPWFNEWYLPLIKRGVIIAETHPRGGGEKGNAWHMGGFKTTKPNTWKDFISCADYLIKNKYTSPNKLIGEGGSAGGILIGRAITERPEIFAASIHRVPVSNAFRHENRTIGSVDAKEFGTVKDSVEAMALIEMDAYLNVKNRIKYPAVLAVAGINDATVPAWQPGKLVAAMQTASASGKPVLLLVNYDSGHGSGEKSVWFRDLANKFAFALWQAGHKDFQPVKN